MVKEKEITREIPTRPLDETETTKQSGSGSGKAGTGAGEVTADKVQATKVGAGKVTAQDVDAEGFSSIDQGLQDYLDKTQKLELIDISIQKQMQALKNIKINLDPMNPQIGSSVDQLAQTSKDGQPQPEAPEYLDVSPDEKQVMITAVMSGIPALVGAITGSGPQAKASAAALQAGSSEIVKTVQKKERQNDMLQNMYNTQLRNTANNAAKINTEYMKQLGQHDRELLKQSVKIWEKQQDLNVKKAEFKKDIEVEQIKANEARGTITKQQADIKRKALEARSLNEHRRVAALNKNADRILQADKANVDATLKAHIANQQAELKAMTANQKAQLEADKANVMMKQQSAKMAGQKASEKQKLYAPGLKALGENLVVSSSSNSVVPVLNVIKNMDAGEFSSHRQRLRPLTDGFSKFYNNIDIARLQNDTEYAQAISNAADTLVKMGDTASRTNALIADIDFNRLGDITSRSKKKTIEKTGFSIEALQEGKDSVEMFADTREDITVEDPNIEELVYPEGSVRLVKASNSNQSMVNAYTLLKMAANVHDLVTAAQQRKVELDGKFSKDLVKFRQGVAKQAARQTKDPEKIKERVEAAEEAVYGPKE